MAYENWDDAETWFRSLVDWYKERRDEDGIRFASDMLENVQILRREFPTYETLNAWRSLATLVLRPSPEKPSIHVLSVKPHLSRIYLYSGVETEVQEVAQEQLVSTVYDYIERLKAQ